MVSLIANGFRERAIREAERYGSDPWVLVRELIQNSRDAGARAVWFTVSRSEGIAILACRDDGLGMTLAHARRYLFALYASSKESQKTAAGRFGVGFWSILRFAPSRIVIRSWPQRGEPWEVELDGALEHALGREPPHSRSTGTEVRLERPAVLDEDLAGQVEAAALRSARYLRQNDRHQPLPVRVNGRGINAPFELRPPSASFQKGPARGVVGLGAEPRFELLAKGLLVRTAPSLSDLLSVTDSAPKALEAGDALAPHGVLDGEDVEVLLARGDARETKGLKRLVDLAQRELGRLVERQLAQARPESWWRSAPTRRLVGWSLAAATAGAAVLIGAWLGRGASRGRVTSPSATVSPERTPIVVPHRDVAIDYDGPRPDIPATRVVTVALRYQPASERPAFVVFSRERPDASPTDVSLLPYRGVSCNTQCLDVELDVTGPGIVRLAIPTGHRLVQDSLTTAGISGVVLATAADEPAVRLTSSDVVRVRYRTGPGRPAIATPVIPPTDLPDALRTSAAVLRSRPVQERVVTAVSDVRRLVVYSYSPDTAARWQAFQGRSFAETTLAVGAGDCDVINGLLVLILREAGVPSRLAVGYLGLAGRALPGLHAWAEYRDGDGPWQVADASPESSTEVLEGGAPALAAHIEPTSLSKAPSLAPALPGSSWGAAVWRTGIARPLTVGSLLLLALTAVGGGFLARQRTRRVLHLDETQQPVALLRGALLRPQAFVFAPAIFDRRLIPTAGRRVLSLGEAWTLASHGRLFVTRTHSPLARRAARRRVAVLDGRSDEGRLVADALGAVDLDLWDEALARSRRADLIESVTRELARVGLAWDIRLVRDLGPPLTLDLVARGAFGPGFFTPRLLVLDENESWWVRARGSASQRPHQALFTTADRVCELLRVPDPARARLLAPLALAALTEVRS